jgi:hypothetical protein
LAPQNRSAYRQLAKFFRFLPSLFGFTIFESGSYIGKMQTTGDEIEKGGLLSFPLEDLAAALERGLGIGSGARFRCTSSAMLAQ